MWILYLINICAGRLIVHDRLSNFTNELFDSVEAKSGDCPFAVGSITTESAERLTLSSKNVVGLYQRDVGSNSLASLLHFGEIKRRYSFARFGRKSKFSNKAYLDISDRKSRKICSEELEHEVAIVRNRRNKPIAFFMRLSADQLSQFATDKTYSERLNERKLQSLLRFWSQKFDEYLRNNNVMDNETNRPISIYHNGKTIGKRSLGCRARIKMDLGIDVIDMFNNVIWGFPDEPEMKKYKATQRPQIENPQALMNIQGSYSVDSSLNASQKYENGVFYFSADEDSSRFYISPNESLCSMKLYEARKRKKRISVIKKSGDGQNVNIASVNILGDALFIDEVANSL